MCNLERYFFQNIQCFVREFNVFRLRRLDDDAPADHFLHLQAINQQKADVHFGPDLFGVFTVAVRHQLDPENVGFARNGW